MQTSGEMRRENAKLYSVVIPAQAGTTIAAVEMLSASAPSYSIAPLDGREPDVSQLRLDGRRDSGNKSGKPNETAVYFAVQQAVI